MSLQILARIPADNGMRLRYSHTHTMTVEATSCEWCDGEERQSAAVIIKGETDSFGYEPIAACEACFQKADLEARTYAEALDVEDRAPKEGHVFFISEGYNYDDGGPGWMRSFTSRRAASVFYRSISERADSRGGLYPDKGVQEILKTEADWRLRKAAAERQRELAGWQDDE